MGSLSQTLDERGRVELPAAGGKPFADVPGYERSFWGCFLTQVPVAGAASGKPVEQMEHEALEFLSGAFKGSQRNCPTVDDEAFAVSSAFQRVPYLLWDGVDIFCDHRNLAYIFSPKACGVTLSKAASQRLSGWRACRISYTTSLVRRITRMTCCRGGGHWKMRDTRVCERTRSRW